jgi:hypothetical protein
MRGFCVFVLALLFPATLPAQRVESGVFVMSQGAVEVTRERYGFDGATLADTVDFPSSGIRMESVARYDESYSPVSYALDLFRGAGEVPVQRVDVSFGDTAATWSTHTELGDSAGVTPLEGPYAFMQNLVFAHLAVVLLRYDHATGGDQNLNVWMPEQTAVLTMAIEFTSSTEGTVEIAGAAMNVEVDEGGWLRRATVPTQNVTVESRDQYPTGT